MAIRCPDLSRLLPDRDYNGFVSYERNPMNTRRQALLLAGVLTATVFTAVAAFAGVTHRPTAAAPRASTPIVHVAQQAPTTHWADD